MIFVVHPRVKYLAKHNHEILIAWIKTSNAEMVTISCAEYEEFQAQRKKISELENRVDLLIEALRLTRYKQFGVSSEKSVDTHME